MTQHRSQPNASGQRIGDQHAPLFTLIRDKLRERIMMGEFMPGDRLIENRLSEEMAVSRIPVREALRELAAEGLVTIEPRRGASVAILSDEEAFNMVEVRAALEGLNAQLAAARRTDDAVARLQRILDEGVAAAEREDMQACRQLNHEFHQTLATVPGNDVLREIMDSLRERTAQVFAPNDLRMATENWSEHAAILRAVIAGDSDLAGNLATQHVHNAAKAYREERAKKTA